MAVGTTVPLDTDGAHVGQQHDRQLPDVAIDAGRCGFLTHDGIGLAQDVETLLAHRAHDADRETGAGERVAPHHRRRESELGADGTHLVLEQRAQRLDEGELQIVGEAAHVVVALDVGGAGATTGLDHIRVERSLHEELDLLAVRTSLLDHLARGVLEHPDEQAPDDLALLLGVGDGVELGEEPLGRVDDLEPDAGGCDVVGLDLLALALAQQAVIDEDAGEVVADRLVHESRSDRRVHATRQAADDEAIADLGTDRLDLLVDDVGRRPRGLEARDVIEEVLEHLLTVLGMHDLGVELNTGETTLEVLESGDRSTLGDGHDSEAARRLVYGVAVRHPYRLSLGKIAEERGIGAGHGDRGAAELREPRAGDLAAEREGHRLEAVADSERRDAGVEQARVDLGSAVGVHRRRATGQDHGDRVLGQHLRDGHRRGDDLAVDRGLADPAGDELRVLRAEIDDEDGAVVDGAHRGPFEITSARERRTGGVRRS